MSRWLQVGAALALLASGSARATVTRAAAMVATADSAASAPNATHAAPPVASSTAKTASGVVNLNDASAEELERLPGIGPVRAHTIVEHRRAHPFHRAEDLTKVKGIGRKTFGRLRPYLTLVGPTTLKESPPRN